MQKQCTLTLDLNTLNEIYDNYLFIKKVSEIDKEYTIRIVPAYNKDKSDLHIKQINLGNNTEIKEIWIDNEIELSNGRCVGVIFKYFNGDIKFVFDKPLDKNLVNTITIMFYQRR